MEPQPRNSHWSLTQRTGWLRLQASTLVSLKRKEIPFWRACNTLSQRIMGTKTSTGIAKFDITGMAKGQRAGFVRFGGISHLIGVRIDDKGNRNIFFMDDKGIETVGPKIEKDIIYFKTTNIGKVANFEYSYDNKHFISFGNDFKLGFGRWTGDRLGFYSWNEIEESGYIDIDWFQYEYE